MGEQAPDVLLEKHKALKDRLMKACVQVEIIETQVSLSRDIDSFVFRGACTEFNNLIPNSKQAFGCKSICSLFCHCSDHLFQTERMERHALYMRYFDAKEAAASLLSEIEQTSFAMPYKKHRIDVIQKRKASKHQHAVSEEEQLELTI